MKPGTIDPKIPKLDQKGQSLVEFVLLMSVIMFLSIGVIKVVNGSIAKYWAHFATIVIDDPDIKLNL